MNQKQKRTIIGLAVFSVLYFFLFVFPNLTGSKNEIMLSVFEQDEFAEYPFVLRMLTSDLSFYQALRHFVIYLFYYYGYPFFFFSALAILPIKWILGTEWMIHTQAIVLVLRQIINVLPGILSAGILVFLQTKFKSVWKSLILFIFLLVIPPLVFNNMWWHPDGLLLLYCSLTLFFLDRDGFRFGRNFIFSAIFTGLAVSTKIIGLFFFLAIAVYLVWGLSKKQISIKRTILMALLFIMVMVLSIVISNPVLLLPIERQEVFTAYQSGFSQLSQGFYEKSSAAAKWTSFFNTVTSNYGNLLFILLVFTTTIIGVVKNKNRLINAMILCWAIVPIIYFTFFTALFKDYYLLPAALPLFSCLGTLFEFIPNRRLWCNIRGKEFLKTIFASIFIFLIFSQTVDFIRSDINLVQSYIIREKNSPSIQFFHKLDADFLSEITQDQMLVIYRDWRAYIEPRKNWVIEYDWNFANYDYIEDLSPDLIILEFENVHYFSNSDLLENSFDLEKASKRFEFYRDASSEHLAGYHLLYKNAFGYAFISDALYEEYFR